MNIVIICHEIYEKGSKDYVIYDIANQWRKEGIEVTFLYGIKEYVPADLAVLHVDLSIVPDDYIEFAKQYPITLNGMIKDIRKSTLSKNILNSESNYNGKIIIKSNLNYGGLPEKKLQTSNIPEPFAHLLRKTASWIYNIRKDSFYLSTPKDYCIFDNSNLVPPELYQREDIIVEKFLPEIQDDKYCIRNYYFLGDHSIHIIRKSLHPIVYSKTADSYEVVMACPEIEMFRKKIHFDFGKFDYVIHNGTPILLDINNLIVHLGYLI